MKGKILRLALMIVIICVTVPLGTEVQAKGRCLCPQIYAPVECAHGKVYSNQCVADCRNAKDCVPLGAVAQLEESSDTASATAAIETLPWIETPLSFPASSPQFASECVDPYLCPDIICAPDTVFVPTTCEQCGHCESACGARNTDCSSGDDCCSGTCKRNGRCR